jgi:hypothetical protein
VRTRALIVSASILAAGAGVAMACSSFEESNDDSSGNDGAAPDAPSGTDSPTGAETSSSCVPEPDEEPIADGGAEDAFCDPSGLEVNLATSNAHCGFCGNLCSTNNGCANGACAPQPVTTADVLLTVGHATDTHLYFTSYTSNCQNGSVRRIAFGGIANEPVVTEPAGCVSNVVIRGDNLFYLNLGGGGTGGIRRTSVTNPVPTTPVLVAEPNTYGFTATDDALFYYDPNYRKLTRAQHDGTFTAVVQDDPLVTIRALGADETSVWWTTQSADLDADSGESTLWTQSGSGGATLKRASGLMRISTFTLDADYVYLASETGDILRLRKSDASPPERVTTIVAENRRPRGITLVGDYLYVAVSDGTTYGIQIYRAKKCGGRARLVARGNVTYPALVVGGKDVYFAFAETLYRYETTKQ